MIQTLKKNSLFVWNMIWEIWWILTRAVENLKIWHFDGIFLSKVCNVWAKIIQTSCVVKNDLWFQEWHKEFGEFSHKYLKVMLDKSSVCNILAEGMYFLGKYSPLTFNFLDFPLLVWSYQIPHMPQSSISTHPFLIFPFLKISQPPG